MCCLCQHLIPLLDISSNNKSSVIFIQFIKVVSDFLPLLIKVFEEQLQIKNRQLSLFTEEELYGYEPIPEEDGSERESQVSKIAVR